MQKCIFAVANAYATKGDLLGDIDSFACAWGSKYVPMYLGYSGTLSIIALGAERLKPCAWHQDVSGRMAG